MEEKDGHHARDITDSIRRPVLQESESSAVPTNTNESQAPCGAHTISLLR